MSGETKQLGVWTEKVKVRLLAAMLFRIAGLRRSTMSVLFFANESQRCPLAGAVVPEVIVGMIEKELSVSSKIAF